jgi:3-hydroxy-3-methylglutaryl CoA synthase
MTGIICYGAYIPWMRLQRADVYRSNAWFAPGLKGLAKGERSIGNWDEDAITMAVESARDCLGPRDRSRVSGLAFASTSAPFADRQNAGVIKEALVLEDGVSTIDLGGSQKAGTGALLQTLRAVAGGAGDSLCIASEMRRARPASEAELTNGDAAAAVLIGNDTPIARFVGAHSVSVDFVDHFRAAGTKFDYDWETRWVREEGYAKIAGEAIKAALARFGCAPTSVAHFIAPIAAQGVPASLAKAAGVPATAVRDTLSSVVGYSGAAHALVMLADTLRVAKPGEIILVLGFGQGADVLLFEVTDSITGFAHPQGVGGWLARRKPESNYLKHLAFAGHLALDRGMRAEFDQKQALTALYRNRRTVLGLVGGRCIKTGAVQYPKSEIPLEATDATTGTLEDYPLADRKARIITYTADSLTYTPDPPAYYGTVEFAGGGRLVCEFTDVEQDSVEVGAPMQMMFRIKAVDERRDFIKYFWKAVPAARGN